MVGCWNLSAGLLRAQVAFESSDIPLITIQTFQPQIFDEPRIQAHMKVIDQPDQSNHPDDPGNEYDGLIEIELRGASSQFFPKKGYRLETILLNGQNNNVPLLGMPAENDWILHGPFSDKSLIRNALTYTIGRDLGHWAPRTRFCELIINGDYLGVYVLMEKIKVDKNRVDIQKMGPNDLTGEALTGGYILKIDKDNFFNEYAWTGLYGTDFLWEYPEEDEVKVQQQDYIQAFFNDFETALQSRSFDHPEEGYMPFIDRRSFIDFMLVNELGKNVDGYRISTFMYKTADQDGGKLHMGPLWDFNLAFGNADYCIQGNPEGWVLNFNQACPQDGWLINPWYDRLLSDPTYLQATIERWEELRKGALSTARLLDLVDELVAEIGDAPKRNFERWPVLGTYVWPNYFVGQTYADEIKYLKDWIRARLTWIDINLPQIASQVNGDASGLIVEIGPNPVQDQLDFYLRMEIGGSIRFELTDMQGRMAGGFELERPGGLISRYSWKGISELAAGVYSYRLIINQLELKRGKLLKY